MVSNLPLGADRTSVDLVRHTCPLCGEVWKVYMHYELGGWFYFKDSDGDCPNGCPAEPEFD